MSPQNEDNRWWLSSVVGDDATQYFDLDYAVSIIKQGKLCWQAAASIAVQTSLFNQQPEPTKAEKALAQHIADSAIEPLEALVKIILDKSDKESDRENARTLFHARFALGGLYIVKGDIDRAADILTQVASTKSILEVRRVKSSDGIYEEHTFVEGRERVSHRADIFLGKTLASYEIWPKLIGKGNYEKALYLLTQAAARFHWEATFTFIEVIVDAWAKRCIELNNVGQWVGLIDALAEIASICDGGEEIKELGASPSACKITSSNYWAWKFGKIVGDLWLYGKGDLVEPLMEGCYPSLDDWKNGLAFVSLFSECDEKRDWETAHTFYLEMWERTANYYGFQLFEEGADSSLYWAMRVGLADKFLKPRQPERPKGDGTVVDIMSPKLQADLREILVTKGLIKKPLTKEDILELIHSRESEAVEFKASARWDYRKGALNKELGITVVKTVAAFLNTKGGQLLIGVSDEKKLLGLETEYKTLGKKGRDGYELFLGNLISENIEKGKVFCSEYVAMDFCDIDGNDVCLLNVQSSPEPVYVKEGRDKNFYTRRGNSNQKLNTEEAVKYISLHWRQSLS